MRSRFVPRGALSPNLRWTRVSLCCQETLNAHSEYTGEDADGRMQLQINQYTIKEEIGHGSYGQVYLATDQYGTEYVRLPHPICIH